MQLINPTTLSYWDTSGFKALVLSLFDAVDKSDHTKLLRILVDLIHWFLSLFDTVDQLLINQS